jgi:hypothetical protein
LYNNLLWVLSAAGHIVAGRQRTVKMFVMDFTFLNEQFMILELSNRPGIGLGADSTCGADLGFRRLSQPYPYPEKVFGVSKQ